MTITKSVHVRRSPEDAFRLFVDEMGKWWPMQTGQYSHGGDRGQDIVLESRVGGRFYERFKDGEEFLVGHVTVCERPNRIAFTWSAGEAGDTEIEVTFSADGDGTRVDLEHRAIEKMGDMAKGYDEGWTDVLGYYVRASA
ncbi:MAG: SRPBCC domain-containing protein [Chloroflexota bacterium]|nr:SRPBCC domain-containing protein [Chloroflexota bacterium]